MSEDLDRRPRTSPVSGEEMALCPRDAHRLVEGVLEEFFARSKAKAAGIGRSYLQLWETLEACTAGGKRIRPRMVVRAYELLGGQSRESAATVGASFELLHTALIIHDDVIDRDFTRRGVPNVSGRYRDRARDAGAVPDEASHVGFSVGVIAGDLALSNAYSLLNRVQTGMATRRQLNEILDGAVFAAAAGELLDIDTAVPGSAPLLSEIIEMDRLKTAVYSFQAPLQAGAVLAGAGEPVVAALGAFGRDVGIAYQLADDLLGVFGDESCTGKSNRGDLREGKRTALVAYAADRPEWDLISALIGSPELSAADADYVRTVLVDTGAQGYVRAMAAEYASSARRQLHVPGITEEIRRGLEPIVTAAVDRVR